jgi:hypothetical protein
LLPFILFIFTFFFTKDILAISSIKEGVCTICEKRVCGKKTGSCRCEKNPNAKDPSCNK